MHSSRRRGHDGRGQGRQGRTPAGREGQVKGGGRGQGGQEDGKDVASWHGGCVLRCVGVGVEFVLS